MACLGCLALTGVPAIVLGFVARRSIARSNGARGADGIAIGGIVTGFASLVFTVIFALIVIPLFVGASQGFKNAHAVAEAWRANNSNQCPTVKRLKDEGELSATSYANDGPTCCASPRVLPMTTRRHRGSTRGARS